MAARSGVQPPPVNALTLDEIHARENIQPTPSQEPSSVSSGEGGMGAFNKLLAAMQSKQQEMSNQVSWFNLDVNKRVHSSVLFL